LIQALPVLTPQVEAASPPDKKRKAMTKNILFIQGGGDGGHEADAKLAASLRRALGAAYDVRYPEMPSDDAASDFGWPRQIADEISLVDGEVILVAHSLGASMLLKCLSESEV
jgi:predicted alpha/beta hydrolase family esterase